MQVHETERLVCVFKVWTWFRCSANIKRVRGSQRVMRWCDYLTLPSIYYTSFCRKQSRVVKGIFSSPLLPSSCFLFYSVYQMQFKRKLTYGGVEAQVTDVTGDDGFLLGWSHAEGVVDHCLLHGVHLRGKTDTNTHLYTLVLIFVFLFDLQTVASLLIYSTYNDQKMLE